MRTFFTFSVAFLCSVSLIGQTLDPPPTVLLDMNFEGPTDPGNAMLNAPTGDDTQWVNFDQDHKTGSCVKSPGITPKDWYWESDLGFADPSTANNNAFTSCSYLTNDEWQNRNWLITAPVFIPDSTYWLCWRSLSYYGPDFMDGYHVLASHTSNLLGAFTDTLFSAAQTLTRLQLGSLDVFDYTFSEGYIHANGYTDEEYFFVDSEPNGLFYHGKLEPHSVSLAQYAGQTVYIAFLHDSQDDYQLQIDDILISDLKTSTRTPSDFLHFNIMPNPVSDFAFINWKTRKPQEGHLSVLDQSGRVVFEKTFNTRQEGQVYLDAQSFAPGVYYCRLETASGQATKLLVKI